MEITKRVEEMKIGEQRKRNKRKEAFWLWSVWTYCKKLQSEKGGRGHNIAVSK